MYNPRFEKDVFKRDVRNNVKTLFRKEVEEATPQQLFQAVSYAVRKPSSMTGLQHRNSMRKTIRRPYITCPWNSCSEELSETT